jgi:PTHB1 C-terminus
VQDALAAASNALGCALRLLCLLLQLRFALSAAAHTVLCEHLCVRVSELAAVDGGWHEAADAGLTHLLRTVLAKNAREVLAASDRRVSCPLGSRWITVVVF